MTDTHAHLHFDKCVKDIDSIVERFEKAGGTFLINVGVNLEDSKRAIKIAKLFGFKAAVGVHPHDSKSVSDHFLEELKELASDRSVVAIGETGLDYYRDLSPRDVQREVFKAQIRLAYELKKPLVIHVRNAYEDAYAILKDSRLPNPPGVIHAFSSDTKWAERFIDLGFLIGIGGPLTYPKNGELRKVVANIGFNKIVTETDCPYLPPQRFRGRRNEPAYVRFILEEISDITGADLGEVETTVDANAMRVFGGAQP